MRPNRSSERITLGKASVSCSTLTLNIMEDVLSVVAWFCVEFLLIGTGRIVVRAMSLGRWRGEKVGKGESRVLAPAGALSFRRGGVRVVTHTGLLFVGILFYVGLAVSLLALSSG